MKKVLFSPLFNYPNECFTGDNVAHYHIAKYLWYVCNVKKTGFYEPVYNAKIQEPVQLTFVSFAQQPQSLYFKKPEWINEFLVVQNEKEINELAHGFDFFVNQYRYRGCTPPETNCGYSQDLTELNMYVPPITYKAVYEENLYIDDLELEDRYANFLRRVNEEIAPDRQPYIVLHGRAADPWNRHVLFAKAKYEKVLGELLLKFPNHMFVLCGEGWGDYKHPRVKLLHNYINKEKCLRQLKEHNQCLQYILSAFFCREADLVFVAMSGFTLFIESIRSTKKSPPIPVLWNPDVFEGECTCVKLMQEKEGWYCKEFEEYRAKHPEDAAYQYGIHHFLYYSRNESLLKPYCHDNPNSPRKIIRLAEVIASGYLLDMTHKTKKQEVQSLRNIHFSRYYSYFSLFSFYVSKKLYQLSPGFLRKLLKQCRNFLKIWKPV